MMIVDDVLRQSSREVREHLDPIVRAATYVRIQNVADFFWLHEQDEWSLRDDFYCVALPWPTTWMEWRMPSSARLGRDVGPIDRHKLHALGLVNLAVVMERKENPIQEHGVQCALRMIMMSAEAGVLGEWSWPVDAEGRIVNIVIGEGKTLQPGLLTDALLRGRRDAPTRDSLTSLLKVTHVFPSLLALSFCHAKNIQARHSDVPLALREARHRKGAIPVSRFYTLDIGPIQGAIDRAKQEHGVGLKKALHLVRGHFKHYTESSPLFGEHTGAYWWGMHARGDSRRGDVRKDYNVVPGIKP